MKVEELMALWENSQEQGADAAMRRVRKGQEDLSQGKGYGPPPPEWLRKKAAMLAAYLRERGY